MKVVIINGFAGAGKSTFIKKCSELKKNVYELSMVDIIKEVALKFGWDGVKDEKGRRFLSDLKDAVSRYDKNIIYDSIDSIMQKETDKCGKEEAVFFINSREKEDVEFLKSRYNAISLLIVNNNVRKVTSNHADKNVMENSYDFIICNNQSLDNLHKEAVKFMKMLLDSIQE